jgi:DNA (cytosine-5)-methyltransferase 1
VDLNLKNKFEYKWNLSDGYPAPNIEKNNLNVFGTFISGGGSTMGYKLAGFNHLGGVEIDKKVAAVYKLNHNPKYLFIEDIRQFNKRTDLPNELFNLDILDGSPPCSTFSMAGSREKAWGKSKKFREGQELQTLDDLFFHFIETANKLKPKVIIAENVKGLIQGNAKGYVKEIFKGFNDIGYNVQIFLLNAASMGVPQKRERVFFICSKKELNYPKLKMEFNEKPILFREISDKSNASNLTDKFLKYWEKAKPGESVGLFKTYKKLSMDNVSFTLIANSPHYHPLYARELTKNEYCKIGTFPLDYNFNNVEPKYLIGMSVPPVMMAQISHQIYLQWFKQHNKK